MPYLELEDSLPNGQISDIMDGIEIGRRLRTCCSLDGGSTVCGEGSSPEPRIYAFITENSALVILDRW